MAASAVDFNQGFDCCWKFRQTILLKTPLPQQFFIGLLKLLKFVLFLNGFTCFCDLLNGQPCWESRIRPFTSKKHWSSFSHKCWWIFLNFKLGSIFPKPNFFVKAWVSYSKSTVGKIYWILFPAFKSHFICKRIRVLNTLEH